MRLLRPALVLAAAVPLFAPAQTVPKAERCLLYAVERIGPEQAPKIDGKLVEPVWEGRERIDTLRNFAGLAHGRLRLPALGVHCAL